MMRAKGHGKLTAVETAVTHDIYTAFLTIGNADGQNVNPEIKIML